LKASLFEWFKNELEKDETLYNVWGGDNYFKDL
jgi:hypothetical protein